MSEQPAMNPTCLCPKCAAPLPADAPQGHCPKCLLALALEAQPGEATQAALEQATLDSGSAASRGDQPVLQFQPGEQVRYFGDYELLEEIARGGMGVVWKARQVSLNRPVALKMILSGSFASDAEVKRFRTEAEAAANLQHPNIVSIHEIGQHEGRHYFSMDFVEGQHLGRHARTVPLSLARIAELVAILAEATQYAHQRGILHRDLKPQNVLMDATGQPRITDFGLAKRIAQDSGLTQEGSVMGSPSYMPPEQAGGRLDRICPATDVYALGAILYELLTGRAPFVAETPVATLRLVLETEPVGPRKLNERVPVDLETICLKCLEKDPQRRYATARELAEELRRFLNHESILARPAGRARTAWRGLVRRPWIVTGIASALLLGLAMYAYGLSEQVKLLQWKLAHVGKQPNWKLEEVLPDNFAGFLVLEFLLLQSLPLLRFLHWQAKGKVTPRRLALCITMGLVQASFGVYVGLKGTRLAVWDLVETFWLVFLTVAALSNVWFGSTLVWQSLRFMRTRQDINRREPEAAVAQVRLERPRRFWGALTGLFAASLVVLGYLTSKGILSEENILAAVLSGAGAVGIALSLLALRQASSLAYQSAILPPLLTACLVTLTVLMLEDYRLIFGWLAFSFAGGLLVGWAGRFTGGPDGPRPSLVARLGRMLWSRKTAYAVLFLFLFYLIEGLHGWLVWSRAKARAEARGEKVDWSAFVPPPVPDEQNVFKHPFMRSGIVRPYLPGDPPLASGLKLGIDFIGHGLESGPLISMATLKRLHAEPRKPQTLVALAGQQVPARPIEHIDMPIGPLADVIQQLAAMAQLTVMVDTNQAGLIKQRWDGKAQRWVAEPVMITFTATNTSAVAALDRLLQQHHFEPELDAASNTYRLKPVFTSRAELLERLTRSEAGFEQLEAALERPHASLDWTAETPFNAKPRRNFVRHREQFQGLATRIHLRLLADDPDGALRDVTLLKKMSGVRADPSLVEAMIHVAVAGVLQETISDGMAEGLWLRRLFGPLAATLADMDLLTPWSQAMQAERAYQIECIRRVSTPWRFQAWDGDFFHTAGLCLNFTWPAGGQMTESQKLRTYALAIPPRGWFYQNMANVIEAPDLRTACESDKMLVHSEAARSQAVELDIWASRTPYKLLASSTVFTSKPLLTTAQNQTKINLTIVALALERHRVEKRAYPETLAALVPEFSAKLPHDLFNGQPLRYRRTGDGEYLLYSIGWNNKDDGGAVPKDSQDRPYWADDRGDWVWQGVPAKKTSQMDGNNGLALLQ